MNKNLMPAISVTKKLATQQLSRYRQIKYRRDTKTFFYEISSQLIYEFVTTEA